MEWKELLTGAGFLVQDALVEFIERQCEQEVIQAQEDQNDTDILSATRAFVALN